MTVRLSSGAEISATYPEDVMPKGKVTIVIRPEHARLGPPGSGVMEGVLDGIVYLGTDNHFHITTDDGSLGICGTCADALSGVLCDGGYDGVLTCGPRPMMKRVAETAQAAGIPVQVSLEEHMACGLGVCLSCTCGATDGGTRQICKDGPVFSAAEVDWQ